MSRILKVSGGDYRIQVQGPVDSTTGIPTAGGNIILDTKTSGWDYGTVTIVGNLDVQGNVTYIETQNSQVTDNIIQLNFGETGNGITGTSPNLGRSGIEIERGSKSAAQILFDEGVNHYDPATGTNQSGTFVLKTANGDLSGLQVASITNSGLTDFVFDMQNNPYVLRVANAVNYATNINDSSIPNTAIPNVEWVYNYVAASSGVATVDRLYYPPVGGITGSTSSIQAFTASIVFQIPYGQTKMVVSGSGVTVNNVNLYNNTVTNVGTENLKLTASNNNVEVNAILNLNDQTSVPTVTSGTTKLYSTASAGPGNTGLYFANVNNTDELVSRNRAVLLSILL